MRGLRFEKDYTKVRAGLRPIERARGCCVAVPVSAYFIRFDSRLSVESWAVEAGVLHTLQPSLLRVPLACRV
jgi:hypothetical protein